MEMKHDFPPVPEVRDTEGRKSRKRPRRYPEAIAIALIFAGVWLLFIFNLLSGR